MPFSFTGFSSTALLIMLACLVGIEIVKHIRKALHLEK